MSDMRGLDIEEAVSMNYTIDFFFSINAPEKQKEMKILRKRKYEKPHYILWKYILV